MDKKISDRYQKKSQLEHILDIPDTYIGSVEKIESKLYVYDDKLEKIVKKNITYIPGLERIYEEILLNAFDQTVRENTGTTQIKVNIDQENNEISVFNNGEGVPIVLKEEENVYIPEMIFGMLLTSGNYKKGEKRIVGGKNGYGAKLANIFSTEFKLETVDEVRQKKMKITWKDNMTKKNNVKITDVKTKGMTKITFKPDLKRFNITKLSNDIISVMKKRVYDIAANTGKNISVFLNGKKLNVKTFEDYMKLYLKKEEEKTLIVDNTQQRWSVGLFMSDDNFEQVSFVNGIDTSLGGTHVEDVSKKIIKEYIDKLQKKKLKVKNSYVKDKMFIFVKSFIENPSFNSQTKEFMTTRPNNFGSKWEMTKKFSKGLENIGIIEEVTSFAQFKEKKELTKTDGKVKKRLIGIPKLDDANWAGTKKSEKCRLILTEGDSAKAFAMSGLSKIGRDKYGVFPLKGKLLNVKDQSNDKILKNQEITYLKQILGLKQGYKYNSLDETRYGGIIILTDQDVDGSHIKGLVMNMFHTFWPELLKLGFVKSLITPIIKAFKGKEELSFYTLTDYENWKKTNPKNWKIKYYKGLGTSNAKEAKEAMNDIEKKLVTYTWNKEDDNNALNLGFKKDLADERKKWLLKYDREKIINQKNKNIPIADFINKDLIHFSNYDNHRSIPSIIDGLKPTQRKILYTGLKYLNKNEIKVAQFSGLVGQKTDYHHGEQSIVTTVVGMAQNFVGANNCNLFLPNGQFGTRLMGGKDRSSERYIFTNTADISKKIFNQLDDNLLKYHDSDGQIVEPEYYVPSIPMILINGTNGIGTGFSTEVLPHKLEDIVDALKNKINNKKVIKLKPWYRSFSGLIVEESPQKYISYGKYELNKNKKIITITELPIGTWTENYKQFIESIIINKSVSTKEQKKQFIKNYYNYSTESTINFVLEFDTVTYKKILNKKTDEIYKMLKLTTNLSEKNMYLFNKNGNITKYKNANDILNYYYDIRLEYYDLRKQKMIEELSLKVKELKNKVRFIRMVKTKKIDVLNTTEVKLNNDLEKNKFDKIKNNNELSYEYLICMPIRTLTYEKANKMEKEYNELNKQLENLFNKDIKKMWLEDLDNILLENKKYNEYLENEIKTENKK